MIEFAVIEKYIGQFKKLSLAELIFERLVNIQRNPKYLYPFWRLLVLLKWSFLYSSEGRFKRKANVHDLDKLIKLVEKLESGYDGISFKDQKKVRQSFTIIAFQQFAYQDHFSNSIVNRQLVMYCLLDRDKKIQSEFKRTTGIELVDFFNYCYLTYLYLHIGDLVGHLKFNGKLNHDFFEYFITQYSNEELEKYLDLLAIKDYKDFEELHRLRTEVLQLYESNFFVTKPFIYFKEEYRIPHRSVFVQTISHFVYNYLKRNSPSFPDIFGYRLEEYVQMGLEESKRDYLSERDLEKKYKTEKVSDFLVENNILIEVKATELHPRSGVSRSTEILQEDLKTSIVKAYTQLLSTANAIDNDRHWYGIIVTYKEMYFGFGPDAWEEFLRGPIESFANLKKIEIAILPPDNIFFLSISDWDWVVQALKDNTTLSLKEILEKGKECNSSNDPEKQVFMMEQVLSKFFYISKFDLSYHNEANKLINVIPKDSTIN